MIARALLLATALLAASAATAVAQTRGDIIAAPALRASVTVTGDLVRIGDVIDNAGSAAQIAIYRAPDLGTTGSLPVAQVLNALRVASRDRRRHPRPEGNFGDAAGPHARGQGHRAADRARAGAQERPRRSRQSQSHLRPRSRRCQAGCFQQRRHAGRHRALRSAQRPLRRHLRNFQRQRHGADQAALHRHRDRDRRGRGAGARQSSATKC